MTCFSLPFRRAAILAMAGSSLVMSACSVAPGYSEQEEQLVADLAPSQYMPASADIRKNIETQDLVAQATFWAREYQLNPSDLEASIKLAAAVRKMGNPSKAVEITQTTRALHPTNPYLTAEYAAALIASDKPQDAVKAIDEGLSVAPGYARLWSLKGATLDQLENYSLAQKHYQRALQITPKDPNIMSNMGLSYALAGEPKMAEMWLERAVALPGAEGNIHQNLSLIRQLNGKAKASSSTSTSSGSSYSAPSQSRVGSSAPTASKYTPRTYGGTASTSPSYGTPSHINSQPAPRNFSVTVGNESQSQTLPQSSPQTYGTQNSSRSYALGGGSSTPPLAGAYKSPNPTSMPGQSSNAGAYGGAYGSGRQIQQGYAQNPVGGQRQGGFMGRIKGLFSKPKPQHPSYGQYGAYGQAPQPLQQAQSRPSQAYGQYNPRAPKPSGYYQPQAQNGQQGQSMPARGYQVPQQGFQAPQMPGQPAPQYASPQYSQPRRRGAARSR